MNIQDLKSNTTWQEASNTINNNNNKISLAIATLENAKLKNKGYFTSVEKLNEAIPNPTIGSKAYVGTSEPYAIYIVENGVWVDSGYTGGDEIVAKITTDRIENGAVTSEKIATSAFDSTLSVNGKIAPADIVGAKLSELEEKINKSESDIIIEPEYTTEKGYVQSNGSLYTGGVYNYTSPISVVKGSIIKVTAIAASTVAVISIKNNDKYTPVVLGESTSIQSYEYTANADCDIVVSYRRLDSFTITYSKFVKTSQFDFYLSESNEFKDLKNKIVGLSIALGYEERIPDFTTTGGFIQTNGTIYSGGQFVYTSPIQLKKGETIKAYIQSSTSIAALSLTDSAGSSYTMIEQGVAEYRNYEYTASQDEEYVALSYKVGATDKIKIIKLNISSEEGGSEIGTLTTELILTNYALADSTNKDRAYSQCIHTGGMPIVIFCNPRYVFFYYRSNTPDFSTPDNPVYGIKTSGTTIDEKSYDYLRIEFYERTKTGTLDILDISGSYTFKKDLSELNSIQGLIETNDNTCTEYIIAGMGDSQFNRNFTPEKVAEDLGCQGLNFGIGGSRFTASGGNYNNFSFVKLCGSIASKDFTTQKEDGRYSEVKTQIDLLESTDFSKVSLILLNYGTNDYGGNVLIGEQNSEDESTIFGAINKGIKLLMEAYPNLSFLFITPVYRAKMNGDLDCKQWSNSEGKYLFDYVSAIITACNQLNMPVFDLYSNSGINQYNWKKYIGDDGTHWRYPVGREYFARLITKYIRNNLVLPKRFTLDVE